MPKLSWENSVESDGCNVESYQLFNNFINQHLLTQYVQAPTRGNNILDLFLTSDPNFVELIQCENIHMSDHKLVKTYTNFFPFLDKNMSVTSDSCEVTTDFSSLDLANANFDDINCDIFSIEWEKIISHSSVEEFPIIFKTLIYNI